jgi:hypothetical protein
MENSVNYIALNMDESMNCSGGGFAYDVGCAIGFLYRYVQGPAGQTEAYVVWYMQHKN